MTADPTEIPSDSIFKISPNVVFETFDDEVIIINMVSGSYFALDAIALGIWTRLEKHESLLHIIEATKRQYRGDSNAVQSAIQNLASELEQEDLIVRLPAEPADATSVAQADNTVDAASRPVFQIPVLTKFTDMQDLLLLDPIHEVDEMGWPHAKPAPINAALTAENPGDFAG